MSSGRWNSLSRSRMEWWESESIESLLGMEGTGARLYFSKFDSMIRGESLGAFDFNGPESKATERPRQLFVVVCVLAAH